MDIVRDYEMIYILNLEEGDENIPTAVEKVSNLITRLGGEISENNSSPPWGKRRMTYPMNKTQDGFYMLTTFKMKPSQTIELERDLRISEEVLRHLVISLGKD